VTDLRQQIQIGLADRYRLERELGRGGMATVFLAHDLRHDRPVALKVLHPELAATLGPERFQREIRTTARLQHPHILPVLDSGDAATQLWYTMPYVEGESLRDRLRREGQLPLDVALQIAREVADALSYAHSQGIVHRDIKPENILLSRGHALVADFGIARAVQVADVEQLTATGMAVGTPAYMSPEQADGTSNVDGRSDLYSLGCVLYEMLTGEVPYTGRTPQAVIAKRMLEPLPHVRTLRHGVPEAVEQAIRRALAVTPADRFATAAEFAQAMAQPHPGSSTSSTPAAQPPGRLRRVPIGLSALALGLLLGLGVLLAWLRARPEPGVAGPKRLAVLPFENLGDSASEYFADGVTDAVRGKLAAIPSLQVTARSSSSQYKHARKSPQMIGQELGVQYLLTGTVRWENGAGGQNRVQVSPELVQVATGSTEWQAPFDAALTDVFQVQADIAGRVADALNVTLGVAQRQTLAAKPTGSLPAYDAFLKGEEASAHLTRFDAGSLQRAIDFYERAVALDSTFVDAWTQLARAHALSYYSVTPTPAAATAAKQAADRVEALAPGSPAAALARGIYLDLVQHDAPEALTVLQAGLQADPRNVELLAMVAIREQDVGHLDSALALLRRAQALDPRSLIVSQTQALTLLFLRRYPESLAASERALSLGPHDLQSIAIKVDVLLAQGDLAGARAVLSAATAGVDPIDLATFLAVYGDKVWALDTAQQDLLLRLRPNQGAFGNDRGAWGLAIAQIYYLRGDRTEAKVYADSARRAFEEQLRVTPQDPQVPSLLGLSLAYLGRRNDAIREGERGARLSPLGGSFVQGPYNQHQLARIHLIVGEPEQALDQLEPLLKIPYYLSPGWLKIDPNFAPLRGNPRFERLVNGT
jgi:serine/threonine-protein kinase